MSKFTIADLVDAMEAIAPTHLAESWDNVGLIVGDRATRISSILLTIDYTDDVALEAKQIGANAIVSYHPPIFDALKRITSDRKTGLIFDAICRGIALYSPHTALDVVEGGTNDALADALALVDRSPLLPSTPTAQIKLVTFVPQNAIEQLGDALFDAGAGIIGDYTRCSFRSAGRGTFKGSASTNPTIGQPDQFEIVDEWKLETIVPMDRLEKVLEALRKNHPYETPAFDLIQLASQPDEKIGLGRIGQLPEPVTAEMAINLLKRGLQIDRVLHAGDPTRLVRTVAVCAGACGGENLSAAIARKADLYITGELRHHDALRALRAGVNVVCTLHTNSERIVLERLKSKLLGRLDGIEIHVSREDRDPFAVV